MADDAQDQRLDVTVPGGKYLAPDGKTFVDANGKPLEKDESPRSGSAKSGGKTAKDRD